ncbi:MAG: AMP-binding protein [Ruminococcus sp.]|nr:AMP-binding protein [Ruminococcus sp.]
MKEREMEVLRKLYQEGTFDFEMYADKITSEDQFTSYEKFQTIGFSYKDDIRKTGPFERTPVAKEDVYGMFSSSGTTGAKTYYVFSKEDKIVHEEFVRRFYTELGVKDSDLGAVCAPVDTGIMAHTMMWQFTTMGAGYVNCPIPLPENIAELVSGMPVTIVATRPDILTSIAFVPELKQKAQASTVTKMLLGGYHMSNARRKLIEDSWNADAYNMFGMSEMFGPMAGECRCKDGQHYPDDYLMIEIIDPETMKPVKPGEMGIAVYTTLWKKGFPLLRYWTDDVMYLSETPCKCGSSMPRLYFQGRLADCIRLSNADGKAAFVFPVMVENVVYPYGIYEYQIKKTGDSFAVTLEYEGDPSALEPMRAELVQLLQTTPEHVSFDHLPLGGLEHSIAKGKVKYLFDDQK